MSWFFGALIILLIGAIAVVAAGRGDAMGEEYGDRPDVTVPDGPLAGDDVRAVRFTTAVRGYRQDEVDALLERLADQLDGERGDRRAADEPSPEA